jgi:molybdenum-dependent DNA-binding transcriptional regulator ModE
LVGNRHGRNVINISVIRLFVRIAECGGIAPAAREFGTPPSVASRQIAALEQALGTKLLTRTTRRFARRRQQEQCYPDRGMLNMFSHGLSFARRLKVP